MTIDLKILISSVCAFASFIVLVTIVVVLFRRRRKRLRTKRQSPMLNRPQRKYLTKTEETANNIVFKQRLGMLQDLLLYLESFDCDNSEFVRPPSYDSAIDDAYSNLIQCETFVEFLERYCEEGRRICSPTTLFQIGLKLVSGNNYYFPEDFIDLLDSKANITQINKYLYENPEDKKITLMNVVIDCLLKFYDAKEFNSDEMIYINDLFAYELLVQESVDIVGFYDTFNEIVALRSGNISVRNEYMY